MNADLVTGGWLGDALLPPDVTPAPRVTFWPSRQCAAMPYHQPPNVLDLDRLLARTKGQMGHTFTERGRS